MPSFGGNTGLRTIWITLRAMNYTTQVFKDAIRDTKLLSDKENEAARATMMAGQHALSAGLMWTVLGQSIDNTLYSTVSSIGLFQQISGVMKPYIAALLTAFGVIQMVIGAEQMYQGLQKSKIAGMIMEKIVATGLASTWKVLAAEIGASVVAFIIFYEIGKSLGGVIPIIIGVTLAVIGLAVAIAILKGVISFGTTAIKDIAMIASLATIGAGVGLALGASQHAMGTRMIQETGPAIVHKGEVIYNPATNRPTQIGNDLANNRPSSTVYEMPIHIENVHTKADFNDVDEQLRQGLHKVARNVRG